MKALPPIFSRVRFQIPQKHQPPVVALVSGEDIKAARQWLTDAKESIDLEIWHHCWLETPSLGMLCASTGPQLTVVKAWNVRDKHPVEYKFSSIHIGGDDTDDLGIIVKGQFYQAALVIHILTASSAEVSVNTLSRNKPRAWLRQGDTMRYARAESLASAAGHARQRDYQRPEEPSGIRMREHAVRGHWRTYASGVRVWVRAHTRGDASLGRVTRVLQ